jgi:N-acetyl sugar amidotransferase
MKSKTICNRCVMDSSADNINFNELGECNYCNEFLDRSHNVIFNDRINQDMTLKHFIYKIKGNGKKKKYDCIVGVSGGVDSSWTLVKAVEAGLNPLAVHMDNGWNSELAQNNIENLITKLNVDLYTHVIEWNEYRGLMQSFFDADVIDVELLYDNAMLAMNYKLAQKYGIKYILSGSNQATEGMKIPDNWNWYKFDKKNIKAISKLNGGPKLKTFPSIGLKKYLYLRYIRGISWIPFLDFYNYIKTEALCELEKNYGYKRYPYKHYESIFTRFYQGFILPKKFGVDKRKLHLSNLIVTKQIKRDEALNLLEQSTYPSNNDLDADKKYFCKKMAWGEKDLDKYIKRSECSHRDYPTERNHWDRLKGIQKQVVKLALFRRI